ncbi:polyprenyl synthetase family protein [Sulfurimonas sp. MAG313]|nr:polyprenyl synthetase family protein [Sulfurimonas sp. MAG313]MDF1880268.1 polyprenyl synthetase family protein [Sulfurimonas sp. MAG313]
MLKAVEQCMLTWIKELQNDEIYELFTHLPHGKRLRAKLVLKIAGETQQSIKLAAVIELIHAASLLHDDVIDEALTRRGVTSINASDGSKIAVMMGDVLYSKAFTELVAFDDKIAQSVAASVTTLSIGEYLDVKMGESFNNNEDAYLDMIYKKTASLIEVTAYAAAFLVGKDEHDYKLYGKNLGLAFQIIDDILDIVSDEKTLGKPALNDYKEGKTTLPYMYLHTSLNLEDKNRLEKAHLQILEPLDSLWIKTKMKEHKSVERSYQLARNLSDEAITIMTKHNEPELVGILEDMMSREF